MNGDDGHAHRSVIEVEAVRQQLRLARADELDDALDAFFELGELASASVGVVDVDDQSASLPRRTIDWSPWSTVFLA